MLDVWRSKLSVLRSDCLIFISFGQDGSEIVAAFFHHRTDFTQLTYNVKQDGGGLRTEGQSFLFEVPPNDVEDFVDSAEAEIEEGLSVIGVTFIDFFWWVIVLL